MIETLLYGCKIGEPSYMEEILYQCKGYTNHSELLEQGQKFAAANNYDRLRIHVIELKTPPNFIKSIKI
jgi:hypothetical protein